MRARANTSKFNNYERTQTQTRAKFNESSSSGQNLIKGAGMSKNLISGPHLRQVVPAAELNFIFLPAARLNFISDPSQD